MPHIDQEKVIRTRNDQNHFEHIYLQCKPPAMGFMRQNINPGAFKISLEDIYQNALIVIYEKICDDSFILSCSIQTYVNSVCRNLLLKQLRDNTKHIVFNGDYNPNITDEVDDTEPLKDRKYKALQRAFEELTKKGGNCAEMLKLFTYQRKSITELTKHFGLKNDQTTKVQKSKCQKRLKILANNYLRLRLV